MIRTRYICFSSDYDPVTQGTLGAPWYYTKQSKRKKKLEGPLGVDPNAKHEAENSKLSFYMNFQLHF